MTGVLPAALPARLLAGMLDDAAVFPPGLALLPDAVTAHRAHRTAWYGDLVGPLVLPASALAELRPLLSADEALSVAITLPGGPDGIVGVLDAAATLSIELAALEVAVPERVTVPELLSALDRTLSGTPVEVFVEVPRDRRRGPLLAALTGRYRAKFRTGGVRAELYPDEAELAAAVCAAVAAGVPFKATAGLHHAVRNTDPATGFEQHGFLNLLLAVDTAASGRRDEEVVAALAERDGSALATRLRGLGERRLAGARARFTSFGTCSVTEPLDELVALGLVAPGTVPEGVRT